MQESQESIEVDEEESGRREQLNGVQWDGEETEMIEMERKSRGEKIGMEKREGKARQG